MATRSQLLETRKEGMRRECEEQRTKCDNIQVPLSVRRTKKEADEFEFRRGGEDAMTLTKLKDRRRRDKIEYDMERCEHKAKTYPKFSDRPDIPFWVHEGKTPDEAPILAPMARTLSEPAFKIHEVPFGDDCKESHHTLPDAAYATAAGLPADRSLTKTSKEKNQQAIGSKTKKSFCHEMIERGFARNAPRLFDAIPPAHCGPRDMESLDVNSSLAPVREAALRKNAEQRKRNAENPKRSLMWSESSGMQHSASVPSRADRGFNDSAFDTPMDAVTSIDASRRSQERSSSVGVPAMRAAARVHHVMSEAAQRAPGHLTQVEAPREPKVFGSFSLTNGVRSGGFQRLDWSASHPPRSGSAPAADGNKRGAGGLTRSQNSRKDLGHSTSTLSAPPL
jgi:hypothetical protein